jgi:hypothetical protein
MSSYSQIRHFGRSTSLSSLSSSGDTDVESTSDTSTVNECGAFRRSRPTLKSRPRNNARSFDETHKNQQTSPSLVLAKFPKRGMWSTGNLIQYSCNQIDDNSVAQVDTEDDSLLVPEDDSVIFQYKEEQQNKTKLTVTFHNIVKTILVPTRHDYKNCIIDKHSLCNDLWWMNADYQSFRTSALHEMYQVMETQRLDGKQASKFLYKGFISCYEQSENIKLTDDEKLAKKLEELETEPAINMNIDNTLDIIKKNNPDISSTSSSTTTTVAFEDEQGGLSLNLPSQCSSISTERSEDSSSSTIAVTTATSLKSPTRLSNGNSCTIDISFSLPPSIPLDDDGNDYKNSGHSLLLSGGSDETRPMQYQSMK